MSVRLTRLEDGYWYIDVRRSPAGMFKAHGRHRTLAQALLQVEALAEGDSHENV